MFSKHKRSLSHKFVSPSFTHFVRYHHSCFVTSNREKRKKMQLILQRSGTLQLVCSLDAFFLDNAFSKDKKE